MIADILESVWGFIAGLLRFIFKFIIVMWMLITLLMFLGDTVLPIIILFAVGAAATTAIARD